MPGEKKQSPSINMKHTQAVENPFPFSDDNKRYHTWNYHLRHTFGEKVAKIPLDGGFTCPNIDGTKGTGGCTYCSGRGSGDFAGPRELDVVTQLQQGRRAMAHKWGEVKAIAYFQAFTNTYAPVERLRALFEPVLSEPGVVGLSVATRPDALPEEVVEYLAELNARTFLTVELGLQSVHDQTGRRINRGHTWAEFVEGYHKLADRGIRVCVHLIDGLPGEDRAMMLETARQVAALRPYSVKIHLLHLLRGTPMAREYGAEAFSLMSMEEYVQTVCDQLELLPPETVIQRVTGDGKKEDLIGPLWSLKKFVVINEIDKELYRRGSVQGIRFGQT